MIAVIKKEKKGFIIEIWGSEEKLDSYVVEKVKIDPEVLKIMANLPQ